MARIFIAFVAMLLTVLPLHAQTDPLPLKRPLYEHDTDFYGGDLRSIFDTTPEFCRAACDAETQCQAFTYNTRSASCFLKTGVERRDPYVGAVSAVMLPIPPEIRARAARRAAALDFLAPGAIGEAGDFVERIVVGHAGGTDAGALLAEARQGARAGDFRAAMDSAGMAAALADRAETWAAYSEYALAVRTNDGEERANLRRDALNAAVASVLRAPDGAELQNALAALAVALEANAQGRASIDALRLALAEGPRADLSAALDRVVGLYGFRVSDSRVDSDAGTPRVCITFSEPLVAGAVDYADYLSLPSPGLAVTADGRDLCIEGMAHGSELALTLRPGLPAQSGEVLARAVDQSFYVRDRTPSLRFPGRAYVLPRSADAAIPLIGVNVPRAEVAIHAIPDAGLRAALRDGIVGSPLAGYDEERLADELGTPVWSGVAELGMELNRDVTTTLPLGETVQDFVPGVYAMTARLPGAEDWERAATQWFIVTDLGLSTLSGPDGVHVFVRGLGSAAPRPGVEVALVARNGAALGRAVTDAGGYAVFPPGLARGTGGSAPALLTATGAEGDYAFLDLTEAAMDLGDRGVAGRAAPPPVDVFIATDRGAYRPGERLNATILARDPASRGIAGLPLTAVILRPDGVEHGRQTLTDAGAGGRVLALDLPDGAMRGPWRLRVHADPEAPALADAGFLVEDFVPERIDFTLDLPEGPVDLSALPPLGIEARFLFGAPGAGLTVDGDLLVSATDGVAGFPGYRFGPTDSQFSTQYAPLAERPLVTGADGRLSLPLFPSRPEMADRPLELTAVVRLADTSGRPVERRITRPVRPDAPLIGVRPLFDGDVPEGSSAAFDVIALGAGGAQVAMPGLRWELVRVETDYQWYELNGRWNFERIESRNRIADGTIDTLADAPVRIEAGVDWGRYELSVAGASGGYARTVTAFDAGWYAADAGTETPDLLEVSLDRESYAAGDTARLRIAPRLPGEIQVMVLADGLIERRSLTVTDTAPVEVDLAVTDAWGIGAYVVASHVRPLERAAGRNPSRAIGLGWVGIEPGPRRLEAAFTSRAEAAPRGVHMASLAVTGAQPGETVFATVSAVDLGILNLTGSEPPDPAAHYLGQRRLGFELRDLYGRLIDGMQGSPGRLRSGGDGGAASLAGPPPTERLMAVFSGPLTLDAEGRASVPVPLPDFNGTVRLDAVVWSASGVGSASQELLVRDPVVLSATLPRFLAPGDRSEIVFDLTHVSGPAGPVSVTLTGTDALPLPDVALSARLEAGGRATLSVPITAGAVGDNGLVVQLTTPDGQVLTKELALGIRANDPGIARQSRLTLEPGQSLDLTGDLLAGLVPGTGRVLVSAGALARFDVPGLLAALDAYPFGCTEQIVSRALPLLYYDQMAASLDLLGQERLDTRMRDALNSVLGRQASDGSFGLWRPGDGDLWLDAYVTDFLSRARAEGHPVSERAFDAALRNLANAVNAAPDFENGGEGLAYALMVLAREGRASIGDLRYYADSRADAFATPLALAQLGAGLAAYGDPARADAMFRAAAARLGEGEADSGWRADYGTAARDRAAVLTLAVEAGSQALDRADLTEAVVRDARPGRSASTQEQLWTVLAAHALGAVGAEPGLTLDGAAPAGPLAEAFDGQDLATPRRIANDGALAVPVVLTVFGTPEAAEPAQGNGYRIERQLFTPEGAPVDPQSIRRNDRIVVVLTVTPERDGAARLMITDPLPAGFEIDNPALVSTGNVAGLDWIDLPDIARHTAAETMRYTAAVDASGRQPIRLAYAVRAISAGVFHHPAASVEDMYRPAFRARGATGQAVIAP
ncbi:alpha-2-macroglobulin family protein [Halovulum dunhuangense]|uniref:Alpha-2-macroglobulin family protein n=1 Tax=Halovulum dunhuangense TaxID=1505036 RepID=A0A849L4Z7_9RHOB|nr:alpha-2-macroglobulin family protein [Halovulum dunhuangense]NNU81445.1 alpha-2-macroglobulin family protein [Halovulum dunhuangense]